MSWFVFVVRLAEGFTVEQRDRVLQGMARAGIQVSNYFPPVHLQPFMVEQYGYREGDFPVTELASKSTIALPFYNSLAKDEVGIVCEKLKTVLDREL
jgi:perosamine synthetase